LGAKLVPGKELAVICDFDETVTNLDTGVLILDNFANGDWRALDRLYDDGEILVEELIRREFSMVRAPRGEMLRLVDRAVSFRPGFEELAGVCHRRGIPLVIASYGLDFCIRHMLDGAGLEGRVEVHAPRAKITSRGITFSFPKRKTAGSVNLKDDLVNEYQGRGRKVVFVGDGTSDFPASKRADIRFAIKDSRLSELCRRDGVQFYPIASLNPVIETVDGRS
jgi:2-hydroxy-3-keto-5-methylthiopentenyl-1-phosphate phosphatase